ncbi:MAG: M1 family metallopeptidase, partial [Gemmatimonadales bacterium]
NSPDSLEALWLHLPQNLFAPKSRGALVNPSSRWRGAFTGGGMQIKSVELRQNGERIMPDYTITDTRMRIPLERPLPGAGGQIQITVQWSFIVPEYGADRMGRFRGEDGWVYEIAQWYPRMAVYDDVNGWNPMPYLGQGEFYLEYGNFEVSIFAPRNLIVVATGVLENPDAVLTPESRARLDRARRSDSTVHIIAPDEVGTDAIVPAGSGMLTWRFQANDVRDFSWAASRAFIWDAARADSTLVMSVYPKEGLGDPANPGWERSTRFVRHSLMHYSRKWYPYPYPVAINVAGVVGGMEYPMIVFCGVDARGPGLFGVTDHEFGHTWFPMVVGSDERRYAWMDEGFNTFINYYSNLDFYGDSAGRTLRTDPDSIAKQMRTTPDDQPIMTAPDLIRRNTLGFLAYSKPGAGLRILREAVLGPERFDQTFRSYIREWAEGHPQPADFFRSMSESSGESLDWFWRGWFLSTDLLDQSVESVVASDSGTTVILENNEGLVMPAPVEVVYADGTREEYNLPVEIWYLGDRYELLLSGNREVTEVILDPEKLLPDVDRANNQWER